MPSKIEWKYGTPPSWLRHITPWWELNFIDNHFHVCWANLVMWKMGYPRENWLWDNFRTCKAPDQPGPCYCGKYGAPTKETPAADAPF